MSRYRNRKHRKTTSVRDYILGVLAMLTVIGVVAGTWAFYSSRPAELIKETLCPPSGVRGHHVILIDKTDPLTFSQSEALKSFMRNAASQVPVGYLLTIFVLGEDFKKTAAPILELCNPGDSRNASELDSNLKKLEKRYAEQYMEKIMTSYPSEIDGSKPANASPIFEMLQLISVKSFGDQKMTGPKRLYIISDMLHNTPQFSMFRSGLNYEAYRRSDYGIKQSLQLKNVEIEIHQLLFQPQIQKRVDFNVFWEKYFENAGVKHGDYKSVPLGIQ